MESEQRGLWISENCVKEEGGRNVLECFSQVEGEIKFNEVHEILLLRRMCWGYVILD